MHLEWAHAIEVDDPAPWLHGRGLVLTTGLRLPRTKQGQEEYVARLVAAGATALGFGTGMRFAAIPFAVAAACRSHDLALVEVPLPTPFLAVVQAVTDRLGELRRLRLVETLADQRQLTRATLRDGVPGLARALARRLGASVVAVGADGAVVAAVGGLDAREVLAEVARPARGGPGGRSQPGSWRSSRSAGSPPTRSAGWPSAGVRRSRRPTGCCSATPSRSRPSSWPAPSAGPEVALGAAVLDAAAGRRVARRRGGADRGRDRPGRRRSPWSASGARTGRAVERALSVVRRQRRLVDAPTDDPGTRMALVAADDVDALAGRAPRRADRGRRPGEPARRCRQLRGRRPPPARHPGTRRPRPRRERPGGQGRRRPGAPVRGRSRGSPHWRRTTRAHDSGLTDALRAFLTHHGSWDPAAQSLGVHRHTLRHRVERAAAVAGFDLDDPGHRALLTLVLGRGPLAARSGRTMEN